MVASRLVSLRWRAGAGAAAAGAVAAGSYDVESAPARFARAFVYASLSVCDYKYGPVSRETHGSQQYKAALSATHQRSAERMLHVCRAHGGLYTKLGQFVASYSHVLPQEYTGTLAECQDRAPPAPFGRVRALLEEELGAPLERIFASFDPEPIAAASLAQVHRAVARGGERLAVKVQYPQLRAQVASDVRTVRALAWLVGASFPDFGCEWLLPTFERAISEELDFRREAANAARTAALFADEPRVHVPRTLAELSGPRVLTMEDIDGAKLTDARRLAELGIEPRPLAALLSRVFSTMVFSHGFVHADPHPGNLLARTAEGGGAQLVLLDHGMYRELEPGFRDAYAELWLALLTHDHARGVRASRALGVADADYDALSLALTFRSAGSRAALGGRMSQAERDAMREKYRDVGAAAVNAFLQRLPCAARTPNPRHSRAAWPRLDPGPRHQARHALRDAHVGSRALRQPRTRRHCA